MRRAVLTLGGTVAGLAALFSYRTHVPGVASAAAPSSPAALSATAPPVTTGSGAASSRSASPSKRATATPTAAKTTAPALTQPGTTAPASTPASTKTAATPTTAAPAPAKSSSTPTPTPVTTKATTQTFEGSNVGTQYGPVQVAITVSGGKITNATDTQSPSDSIAANAVQQLNQEVLTAQSANIQAVSGATYTSDGYIQSLQQAVDQAGL